MAIRAPSHERFFRVDHPVGIDLQLVAQTLAIRAGAVRGVEGEGARLDLRQADAVLGAGQVFGKMQVDGLGYELAGYSSSAGDLRSVR